MYANNERKNQVANIFEMDFKNVISKVKALLKALKTLQNIFSLKIVEIELKNVVKYYF